MSSSYLMHLTWQLAAPIHPQERALACRRTPGATWQSCGGDPGARRKSAVGPLQGKGPGPQKVLGLGPRT